MARHKALIASSTSDQASVSYGDHSGWTQLFSFMLLLLYSTKSALGFVVVQ